ncbi:MAG: cytochrome c3 family protein [Pyrinomonadaceae bacterium]|nr:cytochrome c3 family protein [Pyrinomonadaceae bacterium]
MSDTNRCPRGLKRRLTLLAAPLLALLCLPIIVVVSRRASALGTPPEPTAARRAGSVQDYSRFSHTSPGEHAALTDNCSSCHRRSDGSLEPRFPVHKDCTGCHLTQFTAAISSSENPICTICHASNGLDSSNPPLKKFPGLRSFNAQFDHAQHLQGKASARPAEGCAACHAPAQRGVAKTIPARLNAHQNCYQCHSPGGQAGELSSCGSCHKLGAYAPTSTASRAYRMSFSHSTHGLGQRLNCADCHSVMGRGLPQRRQVRSISPAQHFAPRAQSCMACHNGKRAFGDTNFNDCKRCHKGQTFRMG